MHRTAICRMLVQEIASRFAHEYVLDGLTARALQYHVFSDTIGALKSLDEGTGSATYMTDDQTRSDIFQEIGLWFMPLTACTYQFLPLLR